MDLGTVLVIFGAVLALVAVFTGLSSRAGDHRLLGVAVLLIAIGVLLGPDGIGVR